MCVDVVVYTDDDEKKIRYLPLKRLFFSSDE